jgi:hypothetical protein
VQMQVNVFLEMLVPRVDGKVADLGKDVENVILIRANRIVLSFSILFA